MTTTSSKPARPAKSPGQRLYESTNPWSRDPQHKGRFFWENQTVVVQKKWDDAVVQEAQARRSRKPVHFVTPESLTNTPAELKPEQRDAVERILRRGPR